MRTIISLVLIIISAVIGFFMGAGMNQAMGGAALFAMVLRVRFRLLRARKSLNFHLFEK